MNRTIKLLSVAVICAIFAACASMGKQAPAGTGAPTTVIVDNRALLDMNVYVIRSGQRIRLGLAESLSKTKMTIPPGVVFGSTQVRFLAEPVGSNLRPISEEITVMEGDEITLQLPGY